MGDFKIKKGFDIELDGKPSCEIVDCLDSRQVAIYPMEFPTSRWRLKVEEGDAVKAGTVLVEDKKNEAFKLLAPAAGTISSIIRGERRFVTQIVIDTNVENDSEVFKQYTADELLKADSDDLLAQLLNTGYIGFLRQRPFGGIADECLKPKSIFVNAMNTGPFLADAQLICNDASEAFQAGLNLLTQLTEGKVFLCTEKGAGGILADAENVEIHTFSGAHPAGNTSVHISRVEPMAPTDIVWTIKAVDLVQIGKLFTDGKLPQSRIISLGGNCLKEDEERHYRIPVGGSLAFIKEKIEEWTKIRFISGDILSGSKISVDDFLRFEQSSITVVEESDERHFMGWAMPGITDYSKTRTHVGTLLSWLFGRKTMMNLFGRPLIRLNTNTHGGKRAMVFTGWYDRVMPMNIMVDFLVRAVLAGDTDESIKHGILETLPEDFALCDFVCPSKMEIQDVIRQGLEAIEEEGI